MFMELERLAELYGVKTSQIPSFLNEFAALTGLRVDRRTTDDGTRYSRYVTDWVKISRPVSPVEDYHGKVPHQPFA